MPDASEAGYGLRYATGMLQDVYHRRHLAFVRSGRRRRRRSQTIVGARVDEQNRPVEIFELGWNGGEGLFAFVLRSLLVWNTYLVSIWSGSLWFGLFLSGKGCFVAFIFGEVGSLVR